MQNLATPEKKRKKTGPQQPILRAPDPYAQAMPILRRKLPDDFFSSYPLDRSRIQIAQQARKRVFTSELSQITGRVLTGSAQKPKQSGLVDLSQDRDLKDRPWLRQAVLETGHRKPIPFESPIPDSKNETQDSGEPIPATKAKTETKAEPNGIEKKQSNPSTFIIPDPMQKILEDQLVAEEGLQNLPEFQATTIIQAASSSVKPSDELTVESSHDVVAEPSEEKLPANLIPESTDLKPTDTVIESHERIILVQDGENFYDPEFLGESETTTSTADTIKQAIDLPEESLTQTIQPIEETETENWLLSDDDLAEAVLLKSDLEPIAGTTQSQTKSEHSIQKDLSADSGVIAKPGQKIEAKTHIEANPPVDWMNEISGQHNPEVLALFQKLYTNDTSLTTEWIPLLEMIKVEANIDAFAILLWNPIHVVYQRIADVGLDEITARNLYISQHDAFFDHEKEWQTFQLGEEEERKFHYQKRFSSNFYHSMQTSLVLNLKRIGFPGLCLFFYKDPRQVDQKAAGQAVDHILPDLLPYMVQQTESRWRKTIHAGFSISSLLERVYEILRFVSKGGRDQAHVMHIRMAGMLEHRDFYARLSKCVRLLNLHMQDTDRLIIISPERLILILRNDESSQLKEILRNYDFPDGVVLEYAVLHFPEFGRNLYNYLSFPKNLTEPLG